jgi:hypothetical protein
LMQRLKATFRADAAFDHLLGGQDRRAPALYEDEALRRVEAVFLSAPCGCPMRTNGRGNRGGCHEPKVGIPLALTYVGFGPITELAGLARPLACIAGCRHSDVGTTLSLWAVSGHWTVAMGQSRERNSRLPLADSFGWLFLLRCKFRLLQ